MDWEKHWASYPKTVGTTEYQKQVQNTVNGQPMPDWQFQLVVSGICHHLDLEKDDQVLDLCCGNGLITIELAKKCKEVVGVDFSQPLLEVANRGHRPVNVTYLHMNILDLDKMAPMALGPFDKILMYGGLQYLKRRDLIPVLRNILRLSSEGRVILLGSIPDGKRKRKFYNTAKRRLDYLVRKISGREAIGTWWDKEFIRRACRRLGLQCEFYEQSVDLPRSHYRFDVRIF